MRFSGSLRYMIPWLLEELEDIDELFDGDPWPYGIEPNRHALEVFAQYLLDEGFISEPVTLEKIFASGSTPL